MHLVKHKNNHIELHLGAYFRGGISTFSGMIIFFLMLALIMILAKDLIANDSQKILTVLTLIVFIGVFTNLFLGFEGVEFDLDKKQFRKYVKRLGFKFGDWKKMEHYTMLCLSAQYNRVGRSPASTADNGTTRSLEINLASHDYKPVLLAECKNYKEAQKTLQMLNHYLQLEIKDFVAQQYMKKSPR